MLLFRDFGLQSLGLLFLILKEEFSIQSLVVLGNFRALVLVWFDELLVKLFVKLIIFDFVVGPVICATVGLGLTVIGLDGCNMAVVQRSRCYACLCLAAKTLAVTFGRRERN